MGGEVKSMRIAGGLLGLLFFASACAATNGGIPPSAQGDKLYEAVSSHDSSGVSVIDARTHATERHLPLGVPSSDWSHLYSISGSSLIDTDPVTGVTLSSIQLPGAYRLPAATITGLPGGTSPNGMWLVLEAYEGPASSPTTTHFLIVNTRDAKVVHTSTLKGYFHFDALSNDGQRLFLIQYLNGKEYYVRLYNLLTDTLDENIVVDKSDGNQAMTGLRLSGIATPGGNWLFSMYVRENDRPFIHALSLDGPFAFCLDLPGAGYANNEAEMHWSLAMNRNGTKLYAINGATGQVAELDISQDFNPQITRTARIPGGSHGKAGANAAVLSADGRWLVAAGGTGVVWVDTRSLGAGARSLPDWHIWSLAASPEGRSVYAVRDDGSIAELSIESGDVVNQFDPAAGRPLALMRVAAA
jgi:hypothetical protein